MRKRTIDKDRSLSLKVYDFIERSTLEFVPKRWKMLSALLLKMKYWENIGDCSTWT